jgi:oxygen-independent coproporphyrinogen-3 oxidase
MEVNPSDAGTERLTAFREAGVNRVSLGVQSFLDRQLRATGRDHTADEARTAFRAVRGAGFDNVSLDLIAGLPNQTLDEWTFNLDEALKLEPDHLSLYLLEIKDGTKLAAQIAEGRLPVPDDDLGAEMYERLLDRLEKEGFDAYEISNFARSRDLRSRHNLKYWTDAPFYGFGVGAHGYDGDERYWNRSKIHEYVESVAVGGHALAERTSRTDAEKYFEALMMGLRLREGVSLDRLKVRFGADARETHPTELARLSEAGAVTLDEGVLRLTRSGIPISNEVFLAFL